MNKYNSLLKGQPERMLWWWDDTHTLLCVLSIECDSSQCILLCEFWGLLVKMQTHERTWLCICKLCASDETMSGGHSRVTAWSISPTLGLPHSGCSLPNWFSGHSFLVEPHLLSFLGLNKLPSVSVMVDDIRKKRKKFEKE